MKNDVKPDGHVCPKCGGFYSWASDNDHRCLQCGFVYNPPIPKTPVVRSHCLWGACPLPICDYSHIYCDAHVLKQRKKKGVLVQNMKYTPRKSFLDIRACTNTPIAVRLRKDV